MEFQGSPGPYFGWLHVDPETLADHAERSGWICKTLLKQSTGDHLARLVQKPAV
jgi:hypothetical protein